MARERRILREQAAWKRMFDEPGARPDIAAPDELPMDLEDLAERHRTLQPAHTLLVKRGDREFGAYHGPIIVYDMQVVAKCREGYRTLTTAELDRMYPDPALNVEEFNA